MSLLSSKTKLLGAVTIPCLGSQVSRSLVPRREGLVAPLKKNDLGGTDTVGDGEGCAGNPTTFSMRMSVHKVPSSPALSCVRRGRYNASPSQRTGQYRALSSHANQIIYLQLVKSLLVVMRIFKFS